MKLSPELMMAADESNMAMGEGFAAMIPAPRVPFKASAVASLNKTVGRMASLMGMPYAPEPASGPVAALSPDLVRVLAMLYKAAEDYGTPLDVPMEALVTDDALLAVASLLSIIAGDRDFKDWLKESPPDESNSTELVEEVVPEEEDPEALFRSRARPRMS